MPTFLAILVFLALFFSDYISQIPPELLVLGLTRAIIFAIIGIVVISSLKESFEE